MASEKEKPKKPYRLPAMGKPKEKLKKSSVREIGTRANEEFKKGPTGIADPSFGPKKLQKMSEKDFIKYRELYGRGNDPEKYDMTYAGPGKKPKKGNAGYYSTRRIMARHTGMAKGGLAVKK